MVDAAELVSFDFFHMGREVGTGNGDDKGSK